MNSIFHQQFFDKFDLITPSFSVSIRCNEVHHQLKMSPEDGEPDISQTEPLMEYEKRLNQSKSKQMIQKTA